MEIEEKLDSMIKRYEKQNRGLGCLAPLPIVINDLKHIKKSLPPKQEKVEVPELIDAWIKHVKGLCWGLFELLNPSYSSSNMAIDVQKWLESDKLNAELLAKAWFADSYTVKKEPLYWAVMGVTDYFKCDGKIIVFTKEEEAVEVANLIGINTRVEQLERYDYSDCVLIDELRATI